jgi:hypothetical protein
MTAAARATIHPAMPYRIVPLFTIILEQTAV